MAAGTVAVVVRAVEYLVLGRHPVPVDGAPDDDWFDAADIVIRASDGREFVLGVRTRDYVGAALEGGDPPWPGGHRPLPITLDPSTVRHWDFASLLWIGPDDHPCILWSNAEALSSRALVTMLGPDPVPGPVGRILDGPDDRGLPDPATLGIVVPDGARWSRLVTT